MTRPNLLTPTLRYRDPAAALTWLERALGFTTHFVAREGDTPDGAIVHVQMKLGQAMLYLGPEKDDVYGMKSPLALGGTNQCVCVAVEDVAAAYDRATAAGAVMLTHPRDTGYGATEFSCRDPEGHVWSISNYWGEP